MIVSDACGQWIGIGGPLASALIVNKNHVIWWWCRNDEIRSTLAFIVRQTKTEMDCCGICQHGDWRSEA